jgi:hypothetical protein
MRAKAGQQRGGQGAAGPAAARAEKRLFENVEKQHELNFQAKIQSKTPA